MKRIISGLALGLLLSGTAAIAQTGTGCATQKIGVAALRSLPDGTWTISTIINGRDAPLLLDTAGTVSTTTRRAARDMDLSPTRMRIIDTEHGTLGQGAVPDSFVVAGIHSDAIPLYITETPPPSAPGSFSTNVLGQYDQDIDFAAGKLTLFAPGACGVDAVKWPHEAVAIVPFRMNELGQMVISVTLQGKPVDAVLDSAAPVSHISPLAMKTFGLSQYKAFPAMSLEGITINAPNITVPEKEELPRPYLYLGASTLRNFHIYADSARRQLYITAAR